MNFELINENNDIFSDDTFLNIKNNIYNLYKEKAINVNEINNLSNSFLLNQYKKLNNNIKIKIYKIFDNLEPKNIAI
jgi:hypothetical protein